MHTFASLNRAITSLTTEDNRELKNYDDFVDDDRTCVTVYCANATSKFRRVIVVVSSTTPNKVESRRPAIHKFRQI